MRGSRAGFQGLRGTRSDKTPSVARKQRPTDPTVCERCGAVFRRKTWRSGPREFDLDLVRAARGLCPACRQMERCEFFGRIVLQGAYVAVHEHAIRCRIRNVADRARFTQPQRRVVAIRWEGAELEVLTTCEKLAHRIVRELWKAFRGRVSYKWSDSDGRLFATWRRDDAEEASHGHAEDSGR